MITVLLVDDHAPVRKSLRYLLESAEDIQVVATASNGFEAIARVSLRCPDVAIVDVSMPLMDGIEVTRLLRLRCRETRVMMLSIYDNAEYVQRAVKVGALGFVLKDSIGTDLVNAVRALYAGERFFSKKINQIADQLFSQRGDQRSP